LAPSSATADPPKATPSTDASGSLLDQVSRDHRAASEAIETEVNAALRLARSRIATAPAEVYHDLSLELDRVRKSRDLNTPDRARLAAQIRSIMLQASRQASSHSQETLRSMELNATQDTEAQRLRDIASEQQRAQRTLAQTAADIQHKQFDAAIESADRAQARGGAPEASTAAMNQARVSNRVAYNTAQQDTRNKGFLATTDAMAQSQILIPDSPGIQYPSLEEWKAKTAARERYATTFDEHRVTPGEAKIEAALKSTSQLDCDRMPLLDVISYLKAKHGIEIQLDHKSLVNSLVDSSTLVTMHVKGVKLKSILKLLCDEFELASVRQDDVLLITTKERADELKEMRVYYVGPEVMNPYDMQQWSLHGDNMGRTGRSGRMGRMGGMGGGF
jgi:hypothetical protein